MGLAGDRRRVARIRRRLCERPDRPQLEARLPRLVKWLNRPCAAAGVLWLAMTALPDAQASDARANRAVLTPQAQAGFERLEVLVNTEHALGKDVKLEGVVIAAEVATLKLRLASGAPSALALRQPGAGDPLGRYFGLELAAAATQAMWRPRLAAALDRAFLADPWRQPQAGPEAPPPSDAPGPPIWMVVLAMAAVLGAVAALIWR